MLTLHKTIEETKTVFKWGLILIAAVFLFLILLRTGNALKERFFPTPLPPPTVAFGKLPAINFPPNATVLRLNYKLDTISGTLPNLPDRAAVYKMIKQKPSLSSLNDTIAQVGNAGFNSKPRALSDTLYRFYDTNPPYRNLTINIISHNFTMLSDFISDPTVQSAQNLGDENTAVNTSVGFFSPLSLPNDIDLGKTQTTLYKIVGPSLKKASSLSEAQVIRADFFQKDVNNLPLFYPHPPFTNINDLVASGPNSPQVVEAHFFHQDIDFENSATYPIATSGAAFASLKNGNAYIASYYGGKRTINIRDVFLAYFVPDTESSCLMPIIVFKGDNGFFAYVSAVKDEWIGR